MCIIIVHYSRDKNPARSFCPFVKEENMNYSISFKDCFYASDMKNKGRAVLFELIGIAIE